MATAQVLINGAIAAGYDKLSDRDAKICLLYGASAAGTVTSGTADPTTAPASTSGLYYRTDTGTLWAWDGAAWQPLINP